MALPKHEQKHLLNNASPGLAKAGLGTIIEDLQKPGAAVPNAAGGAPTAAEFKALLDSLRAKGVIA